MSESLVRGSPHLRNTPIHLDESNLLFCCDNDACMDFLVQHGIKDKVDLVYIDPPFHSGERYFHRNENNSNIAFEDDWNSHDYLEMMRSRLGKIWELISPAGSIFVHLDWHALHHVKIIMDDIFGPENFRNEIVVKRGRKKNLQYQFKSIDRMHNAFDSILWYSKSRNAKFQPPLIEHESIAKWMGFWSNVDRPTMRYEIFGYTPERGQWKWSKDRALRAISNYRIYEKKFSSHMPLEEYWELTKEKGKGKLEFIRKRAGVKYAEYWIPPKSHKILDNIWFDVEAYDYSTGYSTEKHEELLERIVGLFSQPGSIIADLFCGSGTTLVVGQRLGRRWIGCDLSPTAISVAKERLSDAVYKEIRL